MAKAKYKKGKRKGRIVVKQRASLVHKNDATRVARKDSVGTRKAPTQTTLPTNAVTFKVKVKKK